MGIFHSYVKLPVFPDLDSLRFCSSQIMWVLQFVASLSPGFSMFLWFLHIFVLCVCHILSAFSSFSLYVYMGLSENRVYWQWNSHLIGIMISKTIGFFGVHDIFRHTHILIFNGSTPPRFLSQPAEVSKRQSVAPTRRHRKTSRHRAPGNSSSKRGEVLGISMRFGFVWK